MSASRHEQVIVCAGGQEKGPHTSDGPTQRRLFLNALKVPTRSSVSFSTTSLNTFARSIWRSSAIEQGRKTSEGIDELEAFRDFVDWDSHSC